MAGDLTVANLNGVPPVQLSTDEIVQADGSHIKNQCTAWVIIDTTATPPTILDSFNVSDVTRLATGRHTLTFQSAMDTLNFTMNGNGRMYGAAGSQFALIAEDFSVARTLSSITIQQVSGSFSVHDLSTYTTIMIFGGRN